MSKAIKDMLVGVILGDAHIRKTGLYKAYITFEQSQKKVEYIQHLQKLAKEELPLMEESLREYTRNDIRYNSTNTSLYFRTESLEQLKPLADLFLDESGKKNYTYKHCRLFNTKKFSFLDNG
jgi:LAGLIDADG DNA endonuclease family